MESRHLKGIGEVTFAAVMFSFVGPVAKVIEMPATALTFWRAIFAVAALAAWMLLRKSPDRCLPRSRNAWMTMIGVGLLTTGNWYFYIYATHVSSVAIAVICLFTYPLMTAMVEPLLLRERFRRVDLFAGVLVVIGVFVLIGRFSLDDQTTVGALFGLAGAACLTIRNILTRVGTVDLGPEAVALFCFLSAGPVLALPAWHFGLPSPRDLGWLLVLGCILTTLSHVAFIASLRHLTSAFASIIVSIQPVLATGIAWLWLDEAIGPRTAIGGGLIIAAIGSSIGWRVWVDSPDAPSPDSAR